MNDLMSKFASELEIAWEVPLSHSMADART
jgi:hypothetical protein